MLYRRDCLLAFDPNLSLSDSFHNEVNKRLENVIIKVFSLGLCEIIALQESPCKKRDNVFTSCYGRHPSDENLHAVEHAAVMGHRVNQGHPHPHHQHHPPSHGRWSASHVIIILTFFSSIFRGEMAQTVV